jgi:coenzyme F420 hydrogenase subunit beta
MNVYGPDALLKNVHEKGLCVGCGACVDLCPYFKNHKGKTAMLFPCDLPRGRCHAHCPKTEVDFDALSLKMWGTPYAGSPLGGYGRAVAAKAGKKMPRGLFQAGGVVSAIMAFSLSTGRVDAAVLTGRKGLGPTAGLATRPDDVFAFATSKYTAAPTIAALNRGIREGFSRMGVVGTPCQITAVSQLRSNPLESADFTDSVCLTVGLFCNWALDTRKLIALLSDRVDVKKILKTDIPPPPADIFQIETEDGRIDIPLQDIRSMIPGGCRICPDMTSEWADISVGNLEGEPGWNTVLIRTEKGEEIVSDAAEKEWLFTREMPRENLVHLNRASAKKKKTAVMEAAARGLLNTQSKDAHAALRMDTDTAEEIIGKEEG